MERLDKLERKTQEPPKEPSVGPGGGAGQRPVMCRKCHWEGHYARGCASLPLPPPARADRHDSEPTSLLPVTHSYRLAGTVNGIPTMFVVDMGASITVLDKEFWERVDIGK